MYLSGCKTCDSLIISLNEFPCEVRTLLKVHTVVGSFDE